MAILRMSILVGILVLLCLSTAVFGQDGRVRIFIMDSQSWQVSGGVVNVGDPGAGTISGGARPQTTEIMKTFAERCPPCIVTMDRERADYTVRLDHEGGKSLVLRDNKVVVFDKMGDLIYSGSTRILGNAVKDACAAIERDKQGKP